jgi:hypothetical protein
LKASSGELGAGFFFEGDELQPICIAKDKTRIKDRKFLNQFIRESLQVLSCFIEDSYVQFMRKGTSCSQF